MSGAPIGFPERVTAYLDALDVMQGAHERSGGEVVLCLHCPGRVSILVRNAVERSAVAEVAFIACRYDMDIADLWPLFCRAGRAVT